MNKTPDGVKEIFRRVFCRPCRGPTQPTVSPQATFWRASGAVMAVILFFAVGAIAQTTNTLSDVEIQGRDLARSLADVRPTTNYTQKGILKHRDAQGKEGSIPLWLKVIVTATNWQAAYFAGSSVENAGGVLVIHAQGQPNVYLPDSGNENILQPSEKMTVKDLMSPVTRDSDFWICDLGLEFFHWPSQKIIKKEFSRGRGCMVLESVNPDPTNGYSKVDSWIDEETYGIVHAEAYDPRGKLLKVFDPKSFKKVNGQWQLEGMEIRNVQAGSRTRIEFDLKGQ